MKIQQLTSAALQCGKPVPFILFPVHQQEEYEAVLSPCLAFMKVSQIAVKCLLEL